jgi:hypothetical protein
MFDMVCFIALPIMLLGITGFVLWIWTLIDCITNEPSDGNDKIIWVRVILLTHLLGAIIYLIVRRPTRIATYGH